MIRTFAIAAGALVLFGGSAIASADPAEQDAAIYAIGKCYDPAKRRCNDPTRSHTTATPRA